MAEDYIQWVIEDRFAAGRPALERVGVQFVEDVAPYEEAKIRILNATHSALAWGGVLRGHGFIHEATADPDVAAVARAYIAQAAIPCLTPSPIDLPSYGEATLRRFANPHIRDTCARVAADGWAKIPGFIAPTIGDAMDRGLALDAVAMLPASYLLFMRRWAERDLPFDYQDQAMDAAAMRAMLSSPDPAAAFCAEPRLWSRLAGDPRLCGAVSAACARLQGRG
jgi:D-arabinitol 4-dehydrogenase